MCPHPPTRRALAGPALAALGLASLAAAPAPEWVEPLFRPRAAAVGGPRVALTLDACGGGFDLRIAAALIETGVSATIFLTGLWLRNNAKALALLLAHRELFAFQNHGAAHVPAILGEGAVFGLPIAGTLAAVRDEVEGGARAVRTATGSATRWFRGAAARYSPAAIAEIRATGHRLAAYSLNADQGASLPAAAVAARMVRARDGEVIIGHINQPGRASGAGIVQGIAALRAAGMGFVTLDALDPG